MKSVRFEELVKGQLFSHKGLDFLRLDEYKLLQKGDTYISYDNRDPVTYASVYMNKDEGMYVCNWDISLGRGIDHKPGDILRLRDEVAKGLLRSGSISPVSVFENWTGNAYCLNEAVPPAAGSWVNALNFVSFVHSTQVQTEGVMISKAVGPIVKCYECRHDRAVLGMYPKELKFQDITNAQTLLEENARLWNSGDGKAFVPNEVTYIVGFNCPVCEGMKRLNI
jgi:hypothetical protein